MEFYEVQNNKCHSKNGLWMIDIKKDVYSIYVKNNEGIWIHVCDYTAIKGRDMLYECKRYISAVCTYLDPTKGG